MPQLKIDADLRSIAKGNVLSDDWSKKIYSVDASEYCFRSIRYCQVCKEYVIGKIYPQDEHSVKCPKCKVTLPPIMEFCLIDKPTYIY